ncbi:hypothetical protein [Krasilnikovia sp. M28-CT-15]|uniref:hypothetical protein n=1 Tax=Krasilnikovia sp. M28-CT-15 TaxID=3373540 RepID=UPI00387633AD
MATLFGSPALAGDNGDGTAGCNYGEICLNYSNPGGNWQRHFWKGGNDTGYWTDVRDSHQTSTLVHDQASSLKNRDSSCDVLEVDYNGTAIRNQQWFANGASSFVGFTSAMNDKNDAHWRCRNGGV